MAQQSNIINKVFHKASSNRKLYVFLFCLCLSILFWLLNALSQDFTTEAIFNVTYINQPIDKVVLNNLPDQLKIKIKGLGFDLLAYKLRLNKSTVIVDLSQLKGLSKKVKSTAISSSSLRIANQFGEKIEIKEIYPDSINFFFDEKVEKVVRIIANTQLHYKKQYQLFGKLLIKPAITRVSGPAFIVDTLTAVYTQKVVLNQLSETATESVGFDEEYIHKKISFNPEKVILHIPVEKFTESSVMVKIRSINVPDSIEIKAIPTEIEVKFLIPLSKMARLGSAKFNVVIDYLEINDNFNHKLKVELTDFPDYIQSLILNPKKVEYILKKRK